MHEYVQKSTSTTLPRSSCDRQRLAVQPVGRSRRSRAPARSRGGRRRPRAPRPAVRSVTFVAALERLPARGARLGVVLEEAASSSEARSGASCRGRRRARTAERGEDRRRRRRGTARRRRAAALLDAPAAERDREQDDRDAERVGDGDRDRLEPEVVGRRPRLVTKRERRARRTGRRRSPSAQPSRKPPPRSPDGRRESRDSGRSIQTPTCGTISVAASRKSSADRDVAQQVLRQPELVEQPGREEDRDEEA